MPKVPVFKCQKMAPRTPNSKNGLQKPRETPPLNGGVDLWDWVIRFHFRASIKPILKNSIFFIVLEPFSPLQRPKSKNGWNFFVYGSINMNFFVVVLLTYAHHWLNWLNLKIRFFLGHPNSQGCVSHF